MNNYQYLNREPQAGDLVLWTDIINPEATNRTVGKPYLVTEILNSELLRVVNDIGNKRNLGMVGLKVLKTKPASEAKVGDVMYRVKGGEGGEFPPGSTRAITQVHSMLKVFSYDYACSADFEDVIVLDQTPDYELGETPIKLRVTPEQSKQIQEICFARNITWIFKDTKIDVRYPYLYISDGITHGITTGYFNEDCNQEVDAEDFINKYKGKTMKTFTKADLKTGMLLEEATGRVVRVLLNTKNGDIAVGDGWFPLDVLPDEINDGDNNYNIIRVYQPLTNKDYSSLDLEDIEKECVWEYVRKQKTKVEVHNAGDLSRTIYINRKTPELIHIGCFIGTFQGAVSNILKKYQGTSAAEYIRRVDECFKLAEKEFKEQ